MQSHSPTTTRPRVLYVDDDASVRRAVGRMLRQHFDLDDVPDAAGVDAALGATRYEGFITDLEMPHVDGFEMIRRVAAIDPRLGRRAVIVTGAHFTEEELEELTAKGYVIISKTEPSRVIADAVLAQIQRHP